MLNYNQQVATIVLARAASEREAPTSLVQWHDFIARYFALGAALKQAISIFDSGQNACAYTQDRRSCAPEVTSIALPEHANGASVNSDVTSEARIVPSAGIKRGRTQVSRRANETEISWEQQRHYALRRRDKRRGLLQKSASGAKSYSSVMSKFRADLSHAGFGSDHRLRSSKGASTKKWQRKPKGMQLVIDLKNTKSKWNRARYSVSFHK